MSNLSMIQAKAGGRFDMLLGSGHGGRQRSEAHGSKDKKDKDTQFSEHQIFDLSHRSSLSLSWSGDDDDSEGIWEPEDDISDSSDDEDDVNGYCSFLPRSPGPPTSTSIGFDRLRVGMLSLRYIIMGRI